MVLAVGFLLLIVIGYLVTERLTPDLAFIEKLSLSYGMGIGLISLLTFLMFYCGLLHSKSMLFAVLVIIALILLAVKPRHKNPVALNGSWKLYCTVLPLFAVSFIFSWWYPIMIADGIFYEATGKLMALNETVVPEHYLSSYPPLIPAMYSFMCFLGGSDHLKTIFPLFYLSLVMCFYCRLMALSVPRKPAIVLTLILATTPYLWWHSFLGLLNLTATYYFSIATLFWFSYLTSKKNVSYLLLAGIFYAFSIFTRHEMLLYCMIPLVICLLRDYLKNIWYLALPPLSLTLLWLFISRELTTLPGMIAPSPMVFVKMLAMRTIVMIFGNIFFLATPILVVLAPIIVKEQIYLHVFILSFLLLNILICGWLYASMYPSALIEWSYTPSSFFKTLFYKPGNIISNGQIRNLLSVYPIIIFSVAMSKRIQKALEV